MAIESACAPIPFEIIMPFSGFPVFKGTWLWGALGCVVGFWFAYGVGAWGGRPLAERYGEITIFVGRLLPLVRTFIAPCPPA